MDFEDPEKFLFSYVFSRTKQRERERERERERGRHYLGVIDIRAVGDDGEEGENEEKTAYNCKNPKI